MAVVKINRFSRSKVAEPDDSVTYGPMEPIPEETNPVMEENENEDLDSFLNELNSDVFVFAEDVEKQEKVNEKEQKKIEQQMNKIEKEKKKQEAELKKIAKLGQQAEKQSALKVKQQQKAEEDSLFSEKGSEIYGRDRLTLISKIQQYKVLFPENKRLKDLKIKKNASIAELHEFIAECEAIVDTDTIESFVTDSILASIKMVEYASVRTRFNIKGLSELLKSNPQFNSLSKQLYIKYKVFGNMPPESQMILLVATSSYICYEKNKQDEKKALALNKVIDIDQFN